MLKIDLKRSSRVPMYQQIAEGIRRQIESGKLPRDSMLPNERSLCESLKINRQTLRKSLQILVEKGLIYKEWGNGAFVGSKPEESHSISMEPAIRIVGMSIPAYCDASHIAVLCDQISQRLARENIQTFRMPHFDSDSERRFLQKSLDFLSGVIFYPKLNSKENIRNIRYVASRNIPCAVMTYSVPDMEIDAVVSDDYSGALAAVDYLVKNGHSRIAFIPSSNRPENRSGRRLGYEYAISNAGLKPIFADAADKPSKTNQFEIGYEAVRDLYIRLRRPPTAIIAQNDILASGAFNALEELDISVPGKTELLGFGNDLEAAVKYPSWKSPISTVAVNHVEIGRTVAELMIRRLREPEAEIDARKIPTKIIHRKTTRG